MITVDGLAALSRALDRLASEQALAPALASAAGRLETAVRAALSHPPGSEHATPWMETGALRDSIGATVGAEGAVVGSKSRVAVFQELGTRTVPPRRFLAPVAQALAPEIVQEIADQVGAMMGGT